MEHTTLEQHRSFSDHVLLPLINAGLTIREAEVLLMLCSGKSNKEIGFALHISTKTVEKHLTRIYSKLEITNRVSAVTWVMQKCGGFPT